MTSSFLLTHRNSGKNQRNVTCKSAAKSQQFLNFGQNDFSKDLLKVFLAADIPLWKLRNHYLKEFFKSIEHPLPTEKTCRLQIDYLYTEEIEKIRQHIKDQTISHTIPRCLTTFYMHTPSFCCNLIPTYP